MRVLGVLAIGLFVSACSDLRAIDEGRCGNQVLDSQEDCDTFSAFGVATACGAPATENSCFYVCEGETLCPAGWGCGDDGRCRQALGEMQRASGSPWRFKVNDFEIGDLDGDGNPDLIGGAESTISIRFGTETGEFPTELSVNTRKPVAPTSITDLNGDGLMDVVVPIFSGLFTMLGQSDQSLQSIAYAPFEILAEGSVRVVPVESNSGDLNTESIVFFANVMQLLFGGGDEQVLPGGHFIDDVAGRIPVADIDQAPNGNDEWALAFRGDSSVYLFSVQEPGKNTPARTVLREEIAIPGQVHLGAQFADVDGNGHLDVMVSILDDNGEHRVAVAYTSVLGVMAVTATIEPAFHLGIRGVWPLATGDLTGDGKSDYVGNGGIYITDFSLPSTIGSPSHFIPSAFPTGNAWSASAVGDYNGDGRADVAVGIENTDGLEFFLGSGAGLFNRFHLDTDGPASILRSADYDGDFVTDLAFVQSGQGVVADELFVSYGETSGGPGDAISMGALGIIKEVEQTNSIIDIDSVDIIRDLVVVSKSFPNEELISIAGMVGSSERRMLSPFTLNKPEDGGSDTPSRVMIGDFVELEGEVVSAKDMIVVASPQEALNGDGPLRYDAWLLPGEGALGGISTIDTGFTLMPEEQSFESDCSEWAVGDLNGDGLDEIIGLDGNARCNGRDSSTVPRLIVVSPSALNGGGLVANPEPVVGGFTFVQSLKALDLDMDGDLDIVVLFAGEFRLGLDGPDDMPAEGSGVVVYWNNSGTISPADYTSVQISGAFRMVDFAPIHLDGDTIPELAVMTNTGIYAMTLDAQTEQYSEPTLLIESFGLGRFDVADVNGDGLDDIAWTEGTDVNVFLGVKAPPLGDTSEAGQ